MVLVDRLSKYAHVYALMHPFTLDMVMQIFIDKNFQLYDMLTSLVSYQDPTFTSQFWKEIFNLQGTELKMNTSYHPQTNAQIEEINK